MEPTYNSLFNELDDFDNRVKLLAVCINLLFAWFGAFKVQQALQINADKLNEDQLAIIPVGEGCKPGFVVFKVRHLQNACQVSLVQLLALQHKVAIGKIQGANAPEIQTLIKDNVFPLKKDE